jgi:hypothetical protein
MSAAISMTDVTKAKTELARMRNSLSRWLKYRTINDAVMAGTRATKKPLGYAQTVIAQTRDPVTEQKLATELHVLLEQVMPDAQLPNPDLNGNPNAAVQLAQVALTGTLPPQVSSATPAGSMPHWLWPVLIVSGLLLGVTTAIRSAADVANQKEQYACIEAGACTDYGFWLKVGGAVAIAWFAWRELGVGDVVKSHINKRRAR